MSLDTSPLLSANLRANDNKSQYRKTHCGTAKNPFRRIWGRKGCCVRFLKNLLERG